jgi:hypothetical protein
LGRIDTWAEFGVWVSITGFRLTNASMIIVAVRAARIGCRLARGGAGNPPRDRLLGRHEHGKIDGSPWQIFARRRFSKIVAIPDDKGVIVGERKSIRTSAVSSPARLPAWAATHARDATSAT